MKKRITQLFNSNYKNKIHFTWLFFLLLGVTLNAQNVNWTSGYPKMDSEPIVTLEDNRILQMRFTPLASNINNAIIEAQLPPNVEYVSTSSPTAGITFNASVSGTLSAGKLVTITVTSNSNKLLQNNEVQFFVNVNAKCASAGVANFEIKVKSGATLVTNGQKSLATNIVVPSLALTSSDGTINYPTQATVNTITYYLKTNTADKASSAKVVFTTDLTSTLSDFKLNGTAFSPTITTSGSNRIYTFAFTQSQLGSKIDNTNNKKITFKGSSTQCGSHVITANVQYPHDSNCASATGSMVTMAFPNLPVPEMTHVSTTYVNSSDAVISNTAVNMNGSTPTNVKTVYRNDGGSNAMNVALRAYPYGQWCYLDIDNIYVQIEGGSKRKVLASEIKVIAKRANNANYVYYKPGVVSTKPYNVEITVTDVVPPGKTVTYWVPTINGDIYNNGTYNVFHDYGTNTINGFVTNVMSLESPCGDAGVTTIVSNRIAYMNVPHYRQLPASMNIKGGATKRQTIHVSPGIGSTAASEFHIQHPNWLSISSITMTQNMNGSGTAYTLTSVSSTPTESVVEYTGGNLTTAYLHIDYQAASCGGSTINSTGQIHYWVNQMWHHPLQKISQVFQNVTLECNIAGITLDNFEVKRTTVGLKDATNDRIPDDGTTAPDTDIRHDVYVEGDEGFFYWEGTVLAGGFKYLDIPIKTTGFTLGTHVSLTGGNSITINGSTSTAPTYTANGTNMGYFRFTHPTTIPSGANIKIKIPFKVISGTNNYNNIETEFYVSATPIGNPNSSASDPNRKGLDKSSSPMGLYNFDRLNHWNKDSRNEAFVDNGLYPANSNIGYVDIFHSGRFSSPWFSHEVRFHEYLEKLVWNLPKGYKLISPLNFRDYTSNTTKTLAEDGSSTTLKKIYDVKSLYDITFDGSGPLAAGKWQRPDDFWRVNILGKVQATKAAKIGNSTMTRVATYRKLDGTSFENTLTVTFIYSGEGVQLDITPKTITAYGPTVKNPVLTITNPNSYAMQDVYFYFDGNIKDVVLKEVGGGTIYNGVGIDKRWVKIPNLAVGGSKSYEMTYTYNWKSTCTNDVVTVYTASGFNSSWSPNTSVALDLTDDAHVGVSDEFIIQTAPATISGSITSNKDTIPEGSMGDYQIKASFTTANSTGALKNPEMIITVPKGQYYVPSSVELEYPVGSLTGASGIEAALVGALGSGTEGSDRTFTLQLAAAKGSDFVIPGNLTPDITTAELTASIVMKFKAACNTDYWGIQYKGEISGTSACNAAASGNGTKIVSPVLYPDVVQNYGFDNIVVATTSGIMAFNEIRTSDTLSLTIKKVYGVADNINASDYLSIKMPDALDIVDSVYYEGTGTMSGLAGTGDQPITNTIIGGVREVKFPMPLSVYNTVPNKGVGENVIYKIPISYTPNGQARAANPVDSIVSTIYAEAQFGACAPVKIPSGSGKDSVALMTADSIPYIVYVGDTAELKITSNGFTGSWYKDKTITTPISTSNPWLHTPTDSTALGDTTYYFSSIINGHDYGRLPYPLSIYIHPWFIQDLGTFKYLCEEEDSLFVRAGGMDVKYQWYYDLTTPITGATDTFYVTDVTGKYHVLVTDSVGEVISSDTMDLYFNEIPVFTKNLPKKVKECDRWGYTLEVETTGSHLLYQWYRDGIKIPGANSPSYYALSQDSSAFFRVSVKTQCGDSIVSNQCYVNFCDQNDSIHINREIRLYAPNSVETDPIVGLHYVQSQEDFEFIVNVKEGYSLEDINIVTNDPIWNDQGGIIKEMVSENSMKVSILTVTKPLVVTVSGINPVSNDEIVDDSAKAWAHNGKIYVNTTEAETVAIFTTMGHLYKHEKVKEGITVFDAEPGIYFVKFNNGYTGKVFVK